MNKVIKIPGTDKSLGGDNVFVIAEIGKNFIQSEDDRSVEEYLENAKKLVDRAVESGVDAVKFQTHVIEDEVLNIDFTSPHFKGADRYSWVTRNMKATPLETFWKPLKKYCDDKGIIFFSTPMSRLAAKKLDEVGVPMWKIGSGDVEDNVALDYLIESGKPIIISTGMVSLDELDEVIKYITARGAELTVLYCISKYPTPHADFNLGTVELLREKYPNVVIGFSDHSIGHDAALAAVKLGAKVVEKHFSLDRELWGSDHKASMTPEEAATMVNDFKDGAHKEVDVTTYYGNKGRELEGANNQFRPYFNKALMAGCDIKAGETVTKDMLYAMRPAMFAGGLAAQNFDKVVGKKAVRAIKKFDPITWEILE